MYDMRRIISVVPFLLVLLSVVPFAQAQHRLPDWAFGPFVRPTGANPIISPNPESTFFDPMSKRNVAWEASDVFNPGAVVKDNRIYVLYRGEDKSGMGIGKRT